LWDPRIGVLLFYGFAVRLALFPFHAWLPELAATTWLPFNLMVMASVKVGAYALLRFVLPVLPAAAEAWATGAVAFGLVGLFYGALMALLQNDLRRLIAYAAVSQNGGLVVGLFALNHAGLQGGLLLALNLSLATAGLFFATSLLQQRTGTTRLDEFGGLFERLPLLGLTFMAAALGTLAMPGTPGFEAAHLALEGMLESFHWAAAYGAAAGNVLVASVLLWAYQRVFFSRAAGPDRPLHDLRGGERWVAAVFCAVIFGIGLYAHPWIETVSASLEQLASAATQSLELD
jgi:NADH-quinone oxidoreductase subunit M